MGDRSQDQDMSAVARDAQQVQAGGCLVALQNVTLSLFGDRISSPDPGMDWDSAMRFLKKQHPNVKKRLEESLLGLPEMEVDAIEMKAVRQEKSRMLALEAVKRLSINGIEVGIIEPQAPIIEIYERDTIQGKLLILGSPGVGKTITLLKLANQLIEKAIENPKTQIPIIFELSTWRDGQEIDAWLIEQLHEIVGKKDQKIYKTWLKEDLLVPLLDGLDELGMERQKACTNKINKFAEKYPQVVVCCRVKEFQNIGVKLSNLRGTLQLKPLSDRQIKLYLQQMGKSGLWEQIQTVPEMRGLLDPVSNENEEEPGLLRVPLFISLAAKVYEQDKPFKGKTDLLHQYIEKQLSREVRESDRDRKELKNRKWAYKAIDHEPKKDETLRYIQWLAKRISKAEITEFKSLWIRHGIAETYHNNDKDYSKLQNISLLETPKQRYIYRFIYFLLTSLATFYVSTIYPSFLFDFLTGNLITLILASLFLYLGEYIGRVINHATRLAFKKSSSDLMFKISSWLFLPVKSTYRNSGSNIILTILCFSILLSFWATTLIAACSQAGGFSIFHSLNLIVLQIIRRIIEFNALFGVSLIGCLLIALPAGVLGSSDNKNKDKKIDFRNTDDSLSFDGYVLICCSSMQLIYLLGLVVVSNMHLELPINAYFPPAAIVLLFAILLIPLRLFKINSSDSIAFWVHLPKYLILCNIEKVMPWRYDRFLDYCHERRLLQKIGGRYRFIHRELLEHFARIEN